MQMNNNKPLSFLFYFFSYFVLSCIFIKYFNVCELITESYESLIMNNNNPLSCRQDQKYENMHAFQNKILIVLLFWYDDI